MARYAFAPAPYVGDAEDARRYATLAAAERHARSRTERTGEPMNIVEFREGRSVVLAVVRRDAEGRVWTDAESIGASLL